MSTCNVCFHHCDIPEGRRGLCGARACVDGVVLPELRCAVVDGTAPHVMEPQYPAAVDRYLDLGRFYDLLAAKKTSEQVKLYTRSYKEAYARAYRYLKAARAVEAESVAEAAKTFPKEKVMRRTEGIIRREFRGYGSGKGETQKRFLGSVTYKGNVWRFDSVETLCPKVYEFSDRWEAAGTLLERLREAAASKGWDSIACMAPETPERMEHLLIPELGLAFISSRPGMQYPGSVYRRIRLDALAEPEGKEKIRFRSRMAEALRDEGIAALKEAKAQHDMLESVYNPYVDFDGVRAVAVLEAGRLLSWMK